MRRLTLLGLGTILSGVVLLLVAGLAALLEDEAHPDIDFTTESRPDGVVVVLWAGVRVLEGSREEAAAWIEANPPVREDYTVARLTGAAGAVLLAAGASLVIRTTPARRPGYSVRPG